jgi:GMP synthase (glutamine-hydrolysing)
MGPLRLLVVEGNSLEDRRRMVAQTGATPGEGYTAVLQSIAPDAAVDLCTPADADAGLPAPLDAYDGVAITGSALNIYKGEPAALRQIAFVQEVFARGIPMFGSCWGLQVATVAAGGEVIRNPRGREVLFARKVALNDAGRSHPLHRGRAAVFDAPAIHGDEVLRLPPDTILTASNALSQVQAAAIRHAGGVFWGTQYHPEYALADLVAIVERYGKTLVDEGFFADLASLNAYAAELAALARDGTRRDIAWRFGLGPDILESNGRTLEIVNWIEALVRPSVSARGRA